MAILVTGSAGFIGSHVTEALLERGDTVIGLDNLNDYYNPTWKQDNLAILEQFDNFQFIKGDILDEALVKSIFDNNSIEYVIHLAARAGVRPSIADPLLYEEVNVRGTLVLLEQARLHQIKHFVLASSSSVYGNRVEVPFSEIDPVNEPISPYAATKKSAEMLGFTYAHLYKLTVTALRFFTVYGERGRPDMAPYLFTEAILTGNPILKFGDGNSKRDYTYITDIVTGVLSALDYSHNGFEVFNLGNNNPISLNEFISTVEEITGKQAIVKQEDMKPGDVEITYANIEKAKSTLNFSPKSTFHEGMTRFVDWYTKKRLNTQ